MDTDGSGQSHVTLITQKTLKTSVLRGKGERERRQV